MTEGVSRARASASKVAKWLLDKSRPDDAVAVLSAWAANGPNDPEGQQLLAEALRIDPAAKIARVAFEAMEGIPGDHSLLELAVAKWSLGELDRVEKEIARPVFRKAQVGFNNNLKYKTQHYHVQTEDSGLDKPHIITHLFADGGRIIKSTKRSYAKEVGRDDVAAYVRALMKGQQLEMVMNLRSGKLDGIIEGREKGGGMDVLDYPPEAEVTRIAGRRPDAPESVRPAKLPVQPAQPASRPEGHVRFRMHVMRSLWGGPDLYEPRGDEVIVGREGGITLEGERFCHPREAAIRYRADGTLWLEDFEGGNGVFLRIRRPVELAFGDEFIVGDQLLRVQLNPQDDDGPDPSPTYFWSSPKHRANFRLVQIFEGGAAGACVVARGTSVQVGSTYGDMIFPHDPLVAEQHCVIEEQAGAVVLTDLGSRTGVFVRIQGEQPIVHGDELLVGRTRLVVDLSPSQK